MTNADDPRGVVLVNRSSVAALAFLAWDILITLDQEVRYIWSRPHGCWTKWLFLFIRYFALAIQISILFVGTELAAELGYSPHACVAWYIWQEVGTEVLIASVEVVLIVRLQALYNRHRALTYALYTLFALENAAMIVTLVRVVPDVRFDAACVVVHSPGGLLYFAVAFIAFETLLFLLMLAKFVQAARRGWGAGAPVLTVLVRDGAWAFAVIFATLCINAGFYLGANGSIAAVAYGWIISVESLAGTRLILNLQSFDDPDRPGEDRRRAEVESRIQFTSHFVGEGDGDESSAGGWAEGDDEEEGEGRRVRRAYVSFARAKERGRGGRKGKRRERGEAFEMTVTESSASGSGSGSGSRGTGSWGDGASGSGSRGFV